MQVTFDKPYWRVSFPTLKPTKSSEINEHENKSGRRRWHLRPKEETRAVSHVTLFFSCNILLDFHVQDRTFFLTYCVQSRLPGFRKLNFLSATAWCYNGDITFWKKTVSTRRNLSTVVVLFEADTGFASACSHFREIILRKIRRRRLRL